MDKNDNYIIEEFDSTIMNRDFLAIKENREYLKILLINWTDKIRTEEEMVKIQPQIDGVNRIFDDLFEVIFGNVHEEFDNLHTKKSGRFSFDKPNIDNNYKKIEVLHYSFKEDDINVHLRKLAEMENQ